LSHPAPPRPPNARLATTLHLNLRRFGPFIASILLTKGLSLIAIPFVTHHLVTADYGRLELIASFVELAGLVMTFGLSDTLFRHASARMRDESAASILTIALLAAFATGLLLQWLAAPIIAAVPILGTDSGFRFGLAAATLTGLIDMPLAWLRLHQRPGQYFLAVAARALAQLGLMLFTLSHGYGVAGVLAGNAAIDALCALILVLSMARRTGFALRPDVFKNVIGYGLPLVGGGLAMFVLGTCDRWILSRHVSPENIATYGLALKLALIVPLLLQPYALWWNAQRLHVLHELDGPEKTARVTGIGFTILLLGALGLCLVAPVFVQLALPAAYRGALDYLPWVVLICTLNESCTLLNAGTYARKTGFGVMAINSTAAIFTLVLYLLLIPPYGVTGAIAATILGHALRLGLYIAISQRSIYVPYPFVRIAVIALLAANLILLGSRLTDPLHMLLAPILAPLLLLGASWALGLVRLPQGTNGLSVTA